MLVLSDASTRVPQIALRWQVPCVLCVALGYVTLEAMKPLPDDAMIHGPC